MEPQQEESGEGNGSANQAAQSRREDVDSQWNDLNKSQDGDIKPVPGVSGESENGSLVRDDAFSTVDQPSHEDVMRLEKDRERLQKINEEKNMVFETIVGQLPDRIREKFKRCVTDILNDTTLTSTLEFSELSAGELKRLTKWLTEHKPFADPKESDTTFEDLPSITSIQEDCVDGVSELIYPHPQPVQQPPAATQPPSRGKKIVERTNSVLGKGTYGEVRIVKHKDQYYAAKELKLQAPDYIRHLYREAANLALLEHDNIVTFCGIGVYRGECNRSHFILTELLATSLHRYLMRGLSICLENQVSILFNVLSGLEYMHEDPAIIHGDLKTNNILLSKKGIAKIADLGSAQLASENVVRSVCGTKEYVAPEAFRRVYTEKIDVFAYGHLSLVTLTRWEINEDEFSKPKGTSSYLLKGVEVSRRRKLFDYFKGEKFQVVKNFVPLIERCLCDEPNQRPPLSLLKRQMQELRLPRQLPCVTTDTAVREECPEVV